MLLQGLETGWPKCTLGFIDRQRVGAVDEGGRHSVKNMSSFSIAAVEKRPQLKALWVPFALLVLAAGFCCAGCCFPFSFEKAPALALRRRRVHTLNCLG